MNSPSEERCDTDAGSYHKQDGNPYVGPSAVMVAKKLDTGSQTGHNSNQRIGQDGSFGQN